MRRFAGILGICVVVGLMWGSLPAETPESKDKAEAPEVDEAPVQIAEEIRQRLHDPVSIKLDQISIPDALEEVLLKHGFEFWLDERALAEASIKVNEVLVSCNLQNVSYRSALKRILGSANLGWVCDDAGICITTLEKQNTTLFARVYEVADLLPEPAVEVREPAALSSDKLGLRQSELSKFVQYAQPPKANASPPPYAHPYRGDPNVTFKKLRPEEELIEAIQNLIGGPPNAPWMISDGEGGTIHYIQTPHAKLLVIKQNEATHAAIEDLLNDLLSHDRMGAEENAEEATPPKNASRQTTVRPRLRLVGKRSAR